MTVQTMDEQRARAEQLVAEGLALRKPVTAEYQLDGDLVGDIDPISGEFGLTYAGYMVWHRSLMERMPLEWQRRMAQCIRDFWEVYDAQKVPNDFMVRARGESGRIIEDPLAKYRHIRWDLVASFRKDQATDG